MSSQQPTQNTPLCHAIVKQVLSGDSIVIRGQPKGKPPKEDTIVLSYVQVQKLARRPTPEMAETKDESFAWEAREFLRKKLIGKEISFILEKPPNSSRKYAIVYIGRDSSGENVLESLVSEGLVSVRRSGVKTNDIYQKLCELEDSAKSAGKGIHNTGTAHHIREITWAVENPRNFLDALHQKPVKGIVEHVRDGSTLRIVLLPNGKELKEYCYITLMLSGIRCPTIPQGQAAEPFAEEAKFFTECRLLQRDVEVILESISNQNFRGTVLHPNGNIAERLLLEGFARIVDWSLKCVTSGFEKLRAAEKQAKEKQLRLWKDYTSNCLAIDSKEKEFHAKVIEIINSDAMIIKKSDGSTKKIFLSSIRAPPQVANKDGKPLRLHEKPLIFEAREFLRKNLIGKKVAVTVDYIQPENNSFPEKTCCSIKVDDVNVAEALVSKGLAIVIKHRADDDQRSAYYDELLIAESKAEKSGKGHHCKKKNELLLRIIDLAGDLQKSKQFFQFLSRAGRMEAIVEFVASGSRLRLFVRRENCLITLLLAGISCERASRETKTGIQPGDPYGDEALAFTKGLCMQKEVQIEVESMDKAGNFIGWLWIDNINLSEALVREGFAEIHGTAEKSSYYRSLQLAQEQAQKKKSKIWANREPVEEEIMEKEEKKERVENYKEVMVTEIRSDLNFFAQYVDEGPKLEEMMQNLRQELSNNPPLGGSYVPKKGDLCAGIFADDGLWYRAKVDKVQGNQVLVIFVDFGNKDITPASKLASLPSSYQSLPPCAHEYSLAFVKPHVDDHEALEDARNAFFEETDNKKLLLNVEYKVGSATYVTLVTSTDEKVDIGKELVTKGFVFVEKRKEKHCKDMVCKYLAAQELAKQERHNLWRYGDITEDDAKEFG